VSLATEDYMSEYKAGIGEFVVHRFLNMQRHLMPFKEDLLQEAALAQLQAEQTYDPDRGMDKDLYVTYKCTYAVYDYVKKSEMPHFKTPEQEDPESQYWHMPDAVDHETMTLQEHMDVETQWTPQYLMPDRKREVWELTDHISFTKNQRIVLESFLETGDHLKAEGILDVSQQRVSQIWRDVLQKIRDANDLS